MDEIKLTKREAIEYAIVHGIDEANKQLNTILKGQSLSKYQNEALLKHLERLADEVEIDMPSPRKTFYILRGLKDSPSDKIDGREGNGNKATPDDLLMDEYIFNRLLKFKKEGRLYGRPISRWLNFVELSDLKIDVKNAIASLNELHKMTHGFIPDRDARTAAYGLVTYLNTRNRDVFERGLGRLKRSGRIQVTYTDLARDTKGDIISLSPDELAAIKETRDYVLSIYDLKYRDYNNMLHYRIPQGSNFEEATEALDEAYKHNHGIKYHFKSIDIQILDEITHKQVSKSEMVNAFNNRLFDLLKDYKGKESPYFQKKYYYINSLTILKDIVTLPPEVDYEIELEELRKEQAHFKTEHEKIFGDITDFF